ncbi:MAG TPA: MlaD family protein [Kofleriaceae bacterium]|nr:MlaD family protein [Kofleriaceae bacterium]
MISVFVLGASIAFFVFLWGRIEIGSHTRVSVYFHHAGGLREGAPFVVAGQAIGRVESIVPSPHDDPNTPLGGDEGVQVIVAISTAGVAKDLKHGADVFVASRGVLSDKYLEIGPTPETGAPLTDGKPILGRDPPSLDRVLQRTWDNLTTFSAFLDDVRPEVTALRGQLEQLGTTIGALPIEGATPLGVEVDALVAEAKRTLDTGLGGRTGLDRLGVVIDHARATVTLAKGSLDALRARATTLQTALDATGQRLSTKGAQAVAKVELAIDRARAAIDKIDPLLAKIAEINDRLARGEGSIGRLANDPEFPEDAKELGKILKRQPWKIVGHPQD